MDSLNEQQVGLASDRERERPAKATNDEWGINEDGCECRQNNP